MGNKAMRAYRRIESFRIAMGVIAILAAVYSGFGILTLLMEIDSSEYGFFVYFVTSITAMIMCAVYAFAVYGKKQSALFGLAAIIFAVGQVVYHIWRFAVSFDELYYAASRHITGSIICLIAEILISVIFIVIALQHFGKLKSISRKLPLVIAVALELLSIIIQFIYGGYIGIGIIFNLIYFVPYLLFIIFCPPIHRRVKINTADAHLQEQELMIGDINERLLHLKNEFENGKITQQEYDYKRKGLLDEL
jgi:uncharacterized membrane protein